MMPYLLLFIVTFFIIVPTILYQTTSGSVGINVYFSIEEQPISCDTLLRNLNITIPVVLIDPYLLKQIDNATCLIRRHPIRIGVDVKYLSENHLLKDPRFEVWFYTNDSKTDYLDFRTDPRKIIPKNFPTRWVANVEVPFNIPMFLGFWKRARFIECLNLKIHREDDKVVLSPRRSTKVLTMLRDELVAHGMFPFLNGGTLLGWYRECSVIPHTQDMDLAVFSENFNPEYLESMRNNQSEFRLSRKLGMTNFIQLWGLESVNLQLNDSMELTVVPSTAYKLYIDIFMMYEEVVNGTINNWVGGLSGNGQKFKYSFAHYDPWCSADLLGHVFWVTCSPKEKLTIEYGPLWYMDHLTKDFSWSSSQTNVKENGWFSKEQMKTVYNTGPIFCDALLRSLNGTVPVLLIDHHLLSQIELNQCVTGRNPVIIGMDVKYLSENHLLKDPRFEVWFYTNDSKTDYLDFRTDPRKIIPKKFPTRWVGNVEVPSNIPMFLGFWKRARFIECLNLTVPRIDKKVVLKPGPSTEVLAKLRDELVAHGMFPFLAGGTLLGWYRECSVIPHTTDMDLAVFSDNFNPEYIKTLKKRHRSEFTLFRKLGMVSDSLEITVIPKKGNSFHLDIFMMYEEVVNGTINHWVGGLLGDGGKLKYSSGQYDPWCSADLHGHVFWVSCSPKEKVTIEYGPLWYMDYPSKNFSWSSSHANVKSNGKFHKSQLKTVYVYGTDYSNNEIGNLDSIPV